jgi:cell wall-associated NlpC family hydrolase
MSLDPRITPARADLAASHLKGKVDAPRYADGALRFVVLGRAALKKAPRFDAPQETELLFGEGFIVYDSADGWAWGQAIADNYVGYLPDAALSDEAMTPTHRVCVPATPLLPEPNVKTPALDLLPMNARVQIAGVSGDYAEVLPEGYVYARHLIPVEDRVVDWVAIACAFVGAPYVWGGKTASGLDCSGLIQTALERAGIASPRDTDMQEKALGQALPVALDNLRRGDLIFWKGHVGVMLDAQQLLHANAFHMQVAIEPLREALARIEPVAGPITSIRRL